MWWNKSKETLTPWSGKRNTHVKASMAREEEKSHTAHKFFVQERSCREVMNKGCKETGLPLCISYSWKAPEEPYKVVRAAIAASALGTLGAQQSEGRNSFSVLHVKETHRSGAGWGAVRGACRRSSQTISDGAFFPWKIPLYQNHEMEKGNSNFRKACCMGI